MSRFTAGRWPLLVVVGLVALGCGGGGAGVVPPASCTDTFRTPNYVSATDPGTGQPNELLIWETFPVQVYRAANKSFPFGPRSYDAHTITTTALDRWVAAVSPGVSYTYVGAPPATGMTVTFSRLAGPPGGGDALGVTTLTYSISTGLLKKADVVINYWDTITEAEVAFGLLFTTTHELGHALFIHGHSPTLADTMYFAASTVETKTLTVRDANSLATAYCGVFPTAAPSGRDVGPYRTVKVTCLRPDPVPSVARALAH